MRDGAVLRSGWFWDAMAGIVVAAGFVFVFASTRVELPGCRELGRTEAEDHATSFLGGAQLEIPSHACDGMLNPLRPGNPSYLA
jgi:hypothetical protein